MVIFLNIICISKNNKRDWMDKEKLKRVIFEANSERVIYDCVLTLLERVFSYLAWLNLTYKNILILLDKLINSMVLKKCLWNNFLIVTDEKKAYQINHCSMNQTVNFIFIFWIQLEFKLPSILKILRVQIIFNFGITLILLS